ncbi:MAG: hypothetical protein BGO95_09925 [Micrococcales bacterium 73-13]|nr:MAG: hypothetical protein BGO95_09925 [Micrococcales bacterium 73-13]
MSAVAAPRRAGEPRLRRLLRRHGYLLALGLTIVLLAVNLVLQPNFGWIAQLASFAPLAVAAAASMPSIVSGRGGIDMSIGPVMTLSGIVFAGYLAPNGLGGLEALPILMLLGGAIGAVNGLIVIWLRLSPIVVTLAMYFIVIGINLKLAPTPMRLADDNWATSLAGSIGGFPGPLISLAIPVALWALLGLTAFRRNLYAVGGNDATAFTAGIAVSAVRVVAFALGGAFAGIAGLVLVALVRTADSSTSSAYTLIAIAAVALGGTSLAGGAGGMTGALLGAASIFLVQSVLADAQVPQTWLPAIYGAMLIVAVVVGALLSGERTGRRA